MNKVKKALLSGRFLLTLIILLFFSSCLSEKTIPANSINALQTKKGYLMIHSDDSTWLIKSYTLSIDKLTGSLASPAEAIPKTKIIHVWIAPASAIRHDGNLVTVPSENIGKVDYKYVHFWKTAGMAFILANLAYSTFGIYMVY
ncbi:MAG: hypothetical protein U0X39_11260 [Bacteroidales bacterium]